MFSREQIAEPTSICMNVTEKKNNNSNEQNLFENDIIHLFTH